MLLYELVQFPLRAVYYFGFNVADRGVWDIDTGEVLEDSGYKEKMNLRVELRSHLFNVRCDFRRNLG
jgi:hypothetical protein